MKSIFIIEAHSTGTYFIDDIIERGYRPVIIYPKTLDTIDKEYLDVNNEVIETYKDKAEFYNEVETYEEILKIARSYNPVAVVTGSERGVEITQRLTTDLGLPTNSVDNIPYFVLKDKMHEACKNHGIRYIKSKNVQTLEEALDFYHSENLDGCVLKPSRGGGSVGVHLCDNEKDMIEIFKEESKGLNIFGEENHLIMQERIYGTEYIVDTISYEGVHKVVSVFRYKKRRSDEGEPIHDYGVLIKDLDKETIPLVDYALDVADAIGFKYGALHGEYTIDENGPVLIEVNCRVRGSSIPVDYLDLTQGHHETDVVIDMYLDHEKFLKEATDPHEYNIKKSGGIKFLSVSHSMNTASFPMLSIAKHLNTYYVDTFGDVDKIHLGKTTNLITCPGKIYLCHDDEKPMLKDLMFLSKLNNQYEKLCFEDIKDYHGGKTIREKVDEFYSLANATPAGEEFVVPEEILENFPYGKEGIELLCESIDLSMKVSDGKLICKK